MHIQEKVVSKFLWLVGPTREVDESAHNHLHFKWRLIDSLMLLIDDSSIKLSLHSASLKALDALSRP